MSDYLTYRPRALVDDIKLNECTIHRASGSTAARWWLLWFYVCRDTDKQPEVFCVPVNPRGSYAENGPGGRTWGLSSVAHGVWQVSPSINVLGSRDAQAGASSDSIWHHTPTITGVPDDEPWARGDLP